MQDFVGSVRRSLVFRSTDGDEEGGLGGGLVEKIGTCIRRSRVGFLSRLSPPALPPIVKDNAPPIRWRKGELIGCGAFGRVYMGMNLDSGELLAVKQVLIPANNASKEKAQTHIRELEEEVKLLKNLSHPNIVRYLGTAREEGTLNILLEFVPGGSISSLLGKFGSFPEPVIRMYTKQLLLGLEYLHKNGIMHRDIKGANILVDNKGCIKLADFGASKKVVELATISGAKSMKGTPYWMAPEVILQTGHSFSADIWSVGCTVIEMATGKPPWSQQYQEVAALFHIGTTKSHPPIPEHLSVEAKDFLLKCLQKEPNLRSTASELLQHPFVTGEYRESHPILRTSAMEASASVLPSSGSIMKNSISPALRPQTTCDGLNNVFDTGSVRCSTVYPEKFSGMGQRGTNTSDDMCQLDDRDDLLLDQSVEVTSVSAVDDFNKSFNPMCEPTDNWPCKFDESPGPEQGGIDLHSGHPVEGISGSPGASTKGDNDFSFPFEPSVSEDDDEVTELKIRAFLDEKALDLKKLQTPLYEEFYNTLNASGPLGIVGGINDENVINYLKFPPKSKSPSQVPSGTPSPSPAVDTASPGSCSRRVSNIGSHNNQCLREIPSPQLDEWKGVLRDSQQEPISPSFSERQRKWKEELDQELERKREIMRQAGVGGKTSSPKDRAAGVGGKTSSPKDWALNRQRDRLWFASPGK
ncbi:mitogen-activated protein kinase kinase kinase NPK1-like [Macadamia integrifolia]|uniref:mitogen-activated protein kinase kinase kinase NPK1-like n=1 Tax=Macadamia integrifolia TaxID=60698 RepID=UPI001C4EF162|nr:mitogen-activated protein kinase kinase kinase NPK1-like [Macadamia integrifolia]